MHASVRVIACGKRHWQVWRESAGKLRARCASRCRYVNFTYMLLFCCATYLDPLAPRHLRLEYWSFHSHPQPLSPVPTIRSQNTAGEGWEGRRGGGELWLQADVHAAALLTALHGNALHCIFTHPLFKAGAYRPLHADVVRLVWDAEGFDAPLELHGAVRLTRRSYAQTRFTARLS